MEIIDYESKALKCPYCNALIKYTEEELIQYWHEYDNGKGCFLYEGIICPNCVNFISEPVHHKVPDMSNLTPQKYLKIMREYVY